jgi:hypothetical protein
VVTAFTHWKQRNNTSHKLSIPSHSRDTWYWRFCIVIPLNQITPYRHGITKIFHVSVYIGCPTSLLYPICEILNRDYFHTQSVFRSLRCGNASCCFYQLLYPQRHFLLVTGCSKLSAVPIAREQVRTKWEKLWSVAALDSDGVGLTSCSKRMLNSSEIWPKILQT